MARRYGVSAGAVASSSGAALSSMMRSSVVPAKPWVEPLWCCPNTSRSASRPWGLCEDLFHRLATANPGLDVSESVALQTFVQQGTCVLLVGFASALANHAQQA